MITEENLLPLTRGSTILSVKSDNVDYNDDIRGVCRKLLRFASENPKIYGISAIQLRSAKRVCLCKLKGSWVLMINPVVVKKFGFQISKEVCCSIPGEKYLVIRPVSAKVKYLSQEFKEYEITLDSYDCRIMFHELDHMDGKLISDKGVRIS